MRDVNTKRSIEREDRKRDVKKSRQREGRDQGYKVTKIEVEKGKGGREREG